MEIDRVADMTHHRRHIRILAVEDDDVDHLTLERALKSCELDVSTSRATTVDEAKIMLQKSDFDCVLLDYHLPDGSGLDLLRSVGGRMEDKYTAVIMLTGEDQFSVAVEAMKCGAQDYLAKKLVSSETLNISIVKALEIVDLQREVKETRQRNEELAFTDPLTGLPNRHVFDDRLDHLIRVSKRENLTFLIGILDMDGFKAINDNLGHQAGDDVLKVVASRLASVVRDSDTVARIGGDEFVLLLPKAEPTYGVETFSRRLLDAVAEPISVKDVELRVGISMGLSQYPTHGSDRETLIQQADEAMYRAKKERAGMRMAGGLKNRETADGLSKD